MDESPKESRFTKWIPRVALFISLCAFIFQVFVLYPWHVELSQELKSLAAIVKRHAA